MNEEQHAVLAAVARFEENRTGPIDEYTVARAAGILATDLDGQTYVQSAERERIRRIFDELEEQGLLRLDRTGYWRPRTSLAGRRALQAPARTRATLAPARAATYPPTAGAVPDLDEHGATAVVPDEEETDDRTWPAWWPAPLRFGDPSAAPVLLAIGVIATFLLVTLVAIAVRGRTGDERDATATITAGALATATAAASGTGPGGMVPGAGAVGRPTESIATTGQAAATSTPRRPPATPTPTPVPFGPTLIIANTNNEGVRVFKTPAGERSFAIPEGEEVQVIGPDQTDSRGTVWKHISYGGQEGFILAEYTKQPEE